MTAARFGILLILLSASPALAADPVVQADAQFDAGDYAAGRKTLVDALDTLPLTLEQRARINDRLARFYEELVGSELQPRRHWQTIVEMPLPPDHPAIVNAREQLARLAADEQKYAEPHQAVRYANYPPDHSNRTPTELRARREEVHARIADLHAIAEQYPDYPHMAHLYHTIGVNHMWLKEYAPAIDVFDKALELRPAIDLMHPTGTFRNKAILEWVHENVPIIAWTVIALLADLFAIAFVFLRRWRRLRWSNALVAAIVLAGWCVLFFGVVAIVKDREFPVPAEAFAEPIEIHVSLGQTGGEHLMPLFWYGLAAVGGSVLFTTVSSAIRNGLLRLGANLAVSLVLSAALTVLVYLGHFSREPVLHRTGNGAESYLKSTFNFHVKTIPVNSPESGEEFDDDGQDWDDGEDADGDNAEPPADGREDQTNAPGASP